jgi:hypothetical protein
LADHVARRKRRALRRGGRAVAARSDRAYVAPNDKEIAG